MRRMLGRNFRKFLKFLGGVYTHEAWSGEKPRCRPWELLASAG